MRCLSAGRVEATSPASNPIPATTMHACSEPRVGRAHPAGGAAGAAPVCPARPRPVTPARPPASTTPPSVSGSVLTQARSAGTTPPRTAVLARARRSPSGRPRLRAARFAVPSGTIPSGTPVPATPAATERTVPSPPAATTRVAPEATARRAWVAPGSDTLVSSHTGRYPARSSPRCRIPCTSDVAAGLEGLSTTHASGRLRRPGSGVSRRALTGTREVVAAGGAPVPAGFPPSGRALVITTG